MPAVQCCDHEAATRKDALWLPKVSQQHRPFAIRSGVLLKQRGLFGVHYESGSRPAAVPAYTRLVHQPFTQSRLQPALLPLLPLPTFGYPSLAATGQLALFRALVARHRPITSGDGGILVTFFFSTDTEKGRGLMVIFVMVCMTNHAVLGCAVSPQEIPFLLTRSMSSNCQDPLWIWQTPGINHSSRAIGP